jgi:hypothetical protein
MGKYALGNLAGWEDFSKKAFFILFFFLLRKKDIK